MDTMKRTATALTVGLLFVQCGPKTSDGDNDAYDTTAVVTPRVVERDPAPVLAAVTDERQTMAAELKTLRADVEERLVDVNNKLARTDLSRATRKAVEQERDSLIGLRSRIDGSLKDIEGADDSTWENVKTGGRNTATDVKDWFKKMGEKVDQETKADADKDGH